MLKCPTRAALAFGLLVGLGPTASKAQEINVILALPAATLTFSAPFLAEDAGFFKREGLKVSVRNIVGVGSVNAVLAGSADFTM
jgi:ABC-type nitrate/sulfonate/bicarbonate transport system substrate-binding protein